jgi:hypothetical protein
MSNQEDACGCLEYYGELEKQNKVISQLSVKLTVANDYIEKLNN